MMRKIWIALLVMTPCLFAYGDEKNSKEVSGGIVTNILNESGTVNGTNFIATTLGTATGDLAGGLGVYIFSATSGPISVAKVHHHWVTNAGDTIFLEDATATAFQVGNFSGVYAVANDSYPVKIIGGTGRFAHATGQLTNTGVIDFNQGKAVLRYQGTINFGNQEH
jgi:hypothetical protein